MRYISVLCLQLVATTALADINTNGPNGIDAIATHLNGEIVSIGEVETTRSGKDGYDSPDKSATRTDPVGVYFKTSAGFDSPDSANIDDHATIVAGIIVGQFGTAEEAFLHSAAFGGGANDVDVALTLNRVATLGGGIVQAINMRWTPKTGRADKV